MVGGRNRAARVLLAVNGAASLLAALVMAVSPELIPATAAIDIQPEAFFVVRLLAATEVAIAALCIKAMQSHDAAAEALAVLVLIVFHLASAAAGVASLLFTWNVVVSTNVAVRLVMVGALAWAPIPPRDVGRRNR